MTDIDLAQTPLLMLNVDALRRNLDGMAEECKRLGVALRPHSKTHKSPWVARQQIERGAVGICTAKTSEAEVMLKAGIEDVLITTEVSGAKIDRLLALTRLGRVRVLVDDEAVAAEIGARARAMGTEVSVVVEINVGQERCGVESEDAAVALARLCAGTVGLRFLGLHGYDGHLQNVRGLAERRICVQGAMERLAGVKAAIERGDIPVPYVTGGGTGTFGAVAASGVVSEVQPGSYVAMDANYRLVEGVSFEHSLFVLASVVSVQRTGKVIVDAGWKALTETGIPIVRDYLDCRYEPAGDEHGAIIGLTGVRPGDPVWLIPRHCDTTVGLFDQYALIDDAGRFIDYLPVAGRGYLA